VDRYDISVSAPSAFTGSFEPHLIESFKKIFLARFQCPRYEANVGYLPYIVFIQAGGRERTCLAFEPNSESCQITCWRRAQSNLKYYIGSNRPFRLARMGLLLFVYRLEAWLCQPVVRHVARQGTVVQPLKLDGLALPNGD